MTTNTTTAPTPLRPSITVAPGALDDVPLVAFCRVISAFGLYLDSDMTIRGSGDLDRAAITAMIEARRQA